MHVALLCNTAWLDEELTLFKYMVVGLMDENVRVAQVVPERLADSEVSKFGSKFTWKDSTFNFVRTWRLGRLANALREQKVDIIHAMDGRLWPAAIRLASKLGCPCVLTANSYLDVPLGHKLLGANEHLRIGLAASTQPLYDALSPCVGASHAISLLRPGVHVPKEPPPINPPANTLCAVISGANIFDSEYESLFIGLAPIVTSYPHAQFFLDGQGSDQHLIWQAAQKLGLLANISLVPRRLGHREILLNADVLIHPQPLGKSRSLTLQAMARGIPVLAHADRWLDYLLHDRTAWLIDRPHPSLWTAAIERLLQQPEHLQSLGHSARQWISEHHLAAWYVNDTIALYRQLLDEPIKFPGSTA